MSEQSKPTVSGRRKPKALHVAVWVHAISLGLTLVIGWIDLIPGSGSVSFLEYTVKIINTKLTI